MEYFLFDLFILNFQMCNDTISDMSEKILISENQEVKFQEEKKKLEEDLQKMRYALYYYCFFDI